MNTITNFTGGHLIDSLDRTLSLFKIEQGLEELLGMMEAAQEEGDSAAAEAIDKAMGEYVQAEVRKVDSIAGAIRGYEALALQAELESERLIERAKGYLNIVNHMKDHAKAAMEAHGVNKLWSAANTLSIQKNGGLEPLEVTDASLVPDDLKTATVTMALEDWRGFTETWEVAHGAMPIPPIRLAIDVDNKKVRVVLGQRVMCESCKGAGDLCPGGPSDAPMETCQRCEGKGTVPSQVPGAKLLPRGSHLRVR